MSATPTGVENPRRAALADIVKNRTDAIAAEITEAGGDASELQPAPDISAVDPKKPADVSVEDWAAMSDEDKAANAVKPTEVTETEEEKVAREAKEAASAETKTEKLKIDGQEQDVGVDKIMDAGRRALQKELAADKRLEEATKARDEAERLRVSVEQTLAKVNKPAETVTKTSAQMLAEKDGMRAIVKKIQYGTEDEAAEALIEYGQKMATLGQPEKLTSAELNNILDLREAQVFVKTNYADVVGDDNLKELFVGKVNKKLAAGDARPYQEICKETGDELRAWKAPTATVPTPQGGTRTAALQRKTSTVSIPAASARQPAPTPTKEPTQSELIAKARMARGQA